MKIDKSDKHVFVIYGKIVEKKGVVQRTVWNSLRKGLSGLDKVPDDDEFMGIYKGTKAECFTMMSEFLTDKSVGIVSKIKNDIINNRMIPMSFKKLLMKAVLHGEVGMGAMFNILYDKEKISIWCDVFPQYKSEDELEKEVKRRFSLSQPRS